MSDMKFANMSLMYSVSFSKSQFTNPGFTYIFFFWILDTKDVSIRCQHEMLAALTSTAYVLEQAGCLTSEQRLS